MGFDIGRIFRQSVKTATPTNLTPVNPKTDSAKGYAGFQDVFESASAGQSTRQSSRGSGLMGMIGSVLGAVAGKYLGDKISEWLGKLFGSKSQSPQLNPATGATQTTAAEQTGTAQGGVTCPQTGIISIDKKIRPKYSIPTLPTINGQPPKSIKLVFQPSGTEMVIPNVNQDAYKFEMPDGSKTKDAYIYRWTARGKDIKGREVYAPPGTKDTQVTAYPLS
ncbi:MAG: hypothetical protein HY901_08530 [Deltaproteobacteria bacterium]|nr:hypothetical protein [Deltaproteobacteria bacterium]